MRLINPSYEIWEQGNTLEDIWKHIARCTRVCYQSEKKNNDETEEAFAKRVILKHKPYSSDKNHLAMLEHGTVYLIGKDELPKSHLISHYSENKYSKLRTIPDNKRGIANYIVTTNLRVLVENNWLGDLEYLCIPTEFHPRRVTVSFTTNIGVSREFNRHRVNSIAEESTRYCNYNLDKFGNKVSFVTPSWDINEGTEEIYINALTHAESAYNKLIKLGWKPQQAREVLPLATKTQLIHTAFVDDWIHFFKLRAIGVSGSPHPNAKILAEPLMEEFIERGYMNKIE